MIYVFYHSVCYHLCINKSSEPPSKGGDKVVFTHPQILKPLISPPSNLKKNTIDYPPQILDTPHSTLLQNKKIGRPISLPFAFLLSLNYIPNLIATFRIVFFCKYEADRGYVYGEVMARHKWFLSEFIYLITLQYLSIYLLQVRDISHEEKKQPLTFSQSFYWNFWLKLRPLFVFSGTRQYIIIIFP